MEEIKQKLEELEKNNLERQIYDFDSPQDTTVTYKGKSYLLFASNNYLGLANDSKLKQKMQEGIEKYGVGSGGSRLTTGSQSIFTQLEEKLAKWKGQEASLLYATGYMANVGVISALADGDWTIFSDALNHASIIDGCRLSKAKTMIYKHCDLEDLENQLKVCETPYKLVVSDGVFSMDGDLLPLKDWLKVCKKYKAITMVDDAHATGVLGEQGIGTPEYFGVSEGIDLHIGTASKALGCEGGFVVGSKEMIRYLKNKSRAFIFSTAMSPAMAYTIYSAIDEVILRKEARNHLREMSGQVRKALKQMGYEVLEGETPIIPILTYTAKAALHLRDDLMANGIIVSAIRPPSVPEGTSRLRLTLTSHHTKAQIQKLLAVMEAYKINENSSDTFL